MYLIFDNLNNIQKKTSKVFKSRVKLQRTTLATTMILAYSSIKIRYVALKPTKLEKSTESPTSQFLHIEKKGQIRT